jgi:2-isopropylmalate synthase
MSGASNIAAKAGKKFDIENDKATLRECWKKCRTWKTRAINSKPPRRASSCCYARRSADTAKFFHLEHYRVVGAQKRRPTRSRSHGKTAVNRQQPTRAPRRRRRRPRQRPRRRPSPALTAALSAIERVRLMDYKVRVINSKDETAAKVRVVVESRREKSDGTKEIFGTIGVSANIIDASWQALVDAYEYHLSLHNDLPNCASVGPKHKVESVMPWAIRDDATYEDREITDEEFCSLRRDFLVR